VSKLKKEFGKLADRLMKYVKEGGSLDLNRGLNGTLKWKNRTGGVVVSCSAIGSDGTIYVGSYDNNLYAIYGSGTLANTPWRPMFHHDLKHTGRVGGP